MKKLVLALGCLVMVSAFATCFAPVSPASPAKSPAPLFIAVAH